MEKPNEAAGAADAPKTMGDDLSTLETRATSDEGRAFYPINPSTGREIGTQYDDAGNAVNRDRATCLILAGIDSDRVRAAMRVAGNRHLKSTGRRGGPQSNAITFEQVEDDAFNKNVAAVIRWQNVSWKGKPLECTKENVAMLLTALPWLNEQVADFVNDRSNFMKGSSTN